MLTKFSDDIETTTGPSVSTRSRHGLDWLVFFVADVQTGFGAFIAVFLTAQKWPQTDIGLALTVTGLTGLVAQIPMGAVVDRLRRLRAAIAVALVLIGGAAFAFAVWPILPVVMASRFVHAVASCALAFMLVTVSLGLAGSGGIGTRLGRNAAFASAGTAIAAFVMGLLGRYVSSQAVFFLATALVGPALYALSRIRPEEIAVDAARQASGRHADTVGDGTSTLAGLVMLTRNRRFVVFAACIVLFHMANAAMLPLAASMLTLRSSQGVANMMVAAAIVVPQLTVMVLSMWVGWAAQRWGRRPFLIVGFASLVLRGFLFATLGDPVALVAIQFLDGISAAALGVLVPLVISDVARHSGHFNLAQGAIGASVSVGAAVSTSIAGWASDHYGSYTAFSFLAIVAAVGFVVVAVVMPETRPREPRSMPAT